MERQIIRALLIFHSYLMTDVNDTVSSSQMSADLMGQHLSRGKKARNHERAINGRGRPIDFEVINV